MKIFVTIVLIFLLIHPSFAQTSAYGDRFEKVDQHVGTVSRQFIYHPQVLAEKLTGIFNNDYDKVRAIYGWIATNTEYDLLAYNMDYHGQQGIYEVLSRGKALCSGFSLLFDYLCKLAGIQSIIIDGYAKGLGYEQNQPFKAANHAWNAVYLHGSWYLLDVTWAAGDPIRVLKSKKDIDLDNWFLTDPGKFIVTHLPEDPSWQLLNDKVSLAEFEQNTGNPFISQVNLFDDYSPEDYAGMTEFDADLLRYKRAVAFNPRNAKLIVHLSFAYIYKGISMTEGLKNLEYKQLIDTVEVFDRYFNAYMDSSELVLSPVQNWKIPKFKDKLKEETSYQRGVFYYEIGKQLYEKGYALKINPDQLNKESEALFVLAEAHFNALPPTSIYVRDAREYLSLISHFREQENTDTP